MNACQHSNTQLFGTDINRALVRWCARNIPFGTFAQNGLAPPLRYPDESFDLIYGISVFTHLPDEMQLPWLAELKRVLKPGGVLYVTLHDSYEWLSPEQEARFKRGLLAVQSAVHAGSNACNAYHPVEYVHAHFGKLLEVVSYMPGRRQTFTSQATWLFRKERR